jgi:hypothetical protein
VEDASGVTRYAYDRQGRVKKTVRTVNGIDYTSEATFDAMGRTETVTYPYREGDTPETLTTTYDAGGNLSGTWFDPSDPEGYYALHSGHNALGQVGSVSHGNGVMTEYAYHALTRRRFNMSRTPMIRLETSPTSWTTWPPKRAGSSNTTT